MSEPGHPERPTDTELLPEGSLASPPESPPVPQAEAEWPTTDSADAVIAVAGTGAVTAMNLTAVTLLGSPAPHQLGLGLGQFIPARYHRVIDAWSVREDGDARASHQDPLTLSLSALRADGGEVWVILTRRILGEGPNAPYLVTMRAATAPIGPGAPPVPRRVRHRPDHPSPVFG